MGENGRSGRRFQVCILPPKWVPDAFNGFALCKPVSGILTCRPGRAAGAPFLWKAAHREPAALALRFPPWQFVPVPRFFCLWKVIRFLSGKYLWYERKIILFAWKISLIWETNWIIDLESILEMGDKSKCALEKYSWSMGKIKFIHLNICLLQRV